MTASRLIAAVLLGTASLVTAFTFSIGTDNMAFTGVMTVIAGAGTAFVALKAPSGRQAWGRGFLGLATTLIVMPMLLASALADQFEGHTAQTFLDDDQAVGRAVVSSMLVGVTTMAGVFFGAIALVIGLILNRRPAPPYAPQGEAPHG